MPPSGTKGKKHCSCCYKWFFPKELTLYYPERTHKGKPIKKYAQKLCKECLKEKEDS